MITIAATTRLLLRIGADIFRTSQPGGSNDTRRQDCEHTRERPGSSTEILHRTSWFQSRYGSGVRPWAAMDRIAYSRVGCEYCALHAAGAQKPHWRLSAGHVLVRRRVCDGPVAEVEGCRTCGRTKEGGLGDDGQIQGSRRQRVCVFEPVNG